MTFFFFFFILSVVCPFWGPFKILLPVYQRGARKQLEGLSRENKISSIHRLGVNVLIGGIGVLGPSTNPEKCHLIPEWMEWRLRMCSATLISLDCWQ